MNKFEVMPLFSYPLFGMNTDFVNDDEIEYIKNLNYSRNYLDNSWVTTDENILYHDKLNNLRCSIEEVFDVFKNDVMKITNDFFICASWAVKHKKKDYAQTHMHKNSFFSGILYLNVDENSGDLVFSNMNGSMFSYDCNEWSVYNIDSLTVKPQKNQMLIFPSSLYHSVNRSNSDIERLVLSFNFFMKEKISIDVTEQLNIKIK